MLENDFFHETEVSYLKILFGCMIMPPCMLPLPLRLIWKKRNWHHGVACTITRSQSDREYLGNNGWFVFKIYLAINLISTLIQNYASFGAFVREFIKKVPQILQAEVLLQMQLVLCPLVISEAPSWCTPWHMFFFAIPFKLCEQNMKFNFVGFQQDMS